MLAHTFIHAVANLSSAIFAESPPTFNAVPTLPGWQELLILLILVTVLVSALYWNASGYEPPAVGTGHGSSHVDEPD